MFTTREIEMSVKGRVPLRKGYKAQIGDWSVDVWNSRPSGRPLLCQSGLQAALTKRIRAGRAAWLPLEHQLCEMSGMDWYRFYAECKEKYFHLYAKAGPDEKKRFVSDGPSAREAGLMVVFRERFKKTWRDGAWEAIDDEEAESDATH